MEKMKVRWGDTIEDAVNMLLEAKREGRHVYCDFNDHKLYSDTVTMDSAYMEICGCTKAEHDAKLKRLSEEAGKWLKEAEEKAIKDIPNKLKRGKALIYPFRYDEWIETVEADAKGTYHGYVTESALCIMEYIEKGKPLDELIEMFKEEGHSGWSSSLTRGVVLRFSKNGYPFYKKTHYGDWSIEECDGILQILQENEENAENLSFSDEVAECKQELADKKKVLCRFPKKQ